MIDAINYCVRVLVMKALGMAINTVLPADQLATVGGQTANFASVKVMTDVAVGDVDRDIIPDGSGGFLERIQSIHKFTASIQFFKSLTKDAQGLATYSNFAFDQAARLPQLIQSSPMIELMQKLGLGFLDASQARNLTRAVDDVWESRGSIDMTFNIVNAESVAMALIGSVDSPNGIQVQEPDGIIQKRNIEVTT